MTNTITALPGAMPLEAAGRNKLGNTTACASRIGLTIDEAAEYTGIGRNTLRRLVVWDKIPVLRIAMNICAHATKEAKRTSARLLDKAVGAV